MYRRNFIYIIFCLNSFLSNASFETDTLRKDGYYFRQHSIDTYWNALFFGINNSYSDSLGNGAHPVFKSIPQMNHHELFYTVSENGNEMLITIDIRNRLPYTFYDGHPTLIRCIISDSELRFIAVKNGEKKWIKTDKRYKFIPF